MTTETKAEPEVKKWQAGDAGRIQVSRFNKAWNALSSEHQHHIEKRGVIGGEEYSSGYYSPFGGGRRDDVLKVQSEIGAQFDWTLTSANAAAVVKAIETALPELAKNRPVLDKRETAEAAGERALRSEEVQRERQAKEQVKNAQIVERAQALRTACPWAIPAGGLSRHAHAAANLREELRLAFPGVRFEVRAETYSGGDAVRVRWELGPSDDKVRAIGQKYVKGHFDGMTDSFDYDTSVEGEAHQQVFGRVRHVSENRDIPIVSIETAAKLLCEAQNIEYAGLETAKLFGENEQGYDTARDHAYRLIGKTSFPPNSVITGLEDDPSDARMPFRLVLQVNEATPDPVENAPASSAAVQVRHNREKDGVEVKFANKPAATVIAELKAAGFRWAKFTQVWYKRYGAYAWAQAHRIADLPLADAPKREGPSADDEAMAQAQENAYHDNIQRAIGA